MTKGTSGLLRDIGVLMKRHPTPIWARMADLIEHRTTRVQVLELLRRASEGRPSANSSKGKRKERREIERSSRIKESIGTDKSERSEWFELELSHLPISNLRRILAGQGVPFSPKDSKQKLIRKAVRQGAQRGGNLSRFLGSDDQNEYARWAEIIMGGMKTRGSRQ